MVTSKADISIVLSGGATNADPEQSLGGLPSNTPVTTQVINNLFDDVTAEEQEGGYEDYRCFYIFNDGSTPIYTVRLWIMEEQEFGSSVEMGIRDATELQRLTVSPIPNTGSMTLSFEGLEFVSNRNSDVSVWATDLQNQLNNLVNNDNYAVLREVKVTAQALNNQIVFDIDFGGGLGGSGHDDKKDHELIAYVSDNFDNDSEVSVAVLQEGSPVNSIAEALDSSLAVPTGVGFYRPAENSPITIVRLLPTEGFPVWVKRVVTDDAEPVENDGFTFRFRANSLDPYA